MRRLELKFFTESNERVLRVVVLVVEVYPC